MADHRIGSAIVTKHDKLVGIFTVTDARIAALAEIPPLQSTPLRSLAAKLSASVVSEPYAHPDRDEIPVPALRLLDAQKSSVDEEGGRIGERPLEPDTRIP